MPTYTVQLRTAAAEVSFAGIVDGEGVERKDGETDAELITRWLQQGVTELNRRHAGRKARSEAVIDDPVVRP